MALIVRALRTGTFGFGRKLSRNLVDRQELTVPALQITTEVLTAIRTYVAAGQMQVITSETSHGLPPNRPSTARKTLLVTLGASGIIPNGSTLNKVTLGGVSFTLGDSNIDGATTAALLSAFLAELAASTALAATGAVVRTSYEPVLPAAVAASKSLNLATLPTANDTVTVNGQVYRFVATPGATANDVAYGADAAAARANLILAINGGANSGNYGTATVANALASAAAGGGTTVLVSARTAGTAGNSIALAEALTDPADVWLAGATALSGGLDTHAVVVIDGDDVADWAAFGETSYVTGSNDLPLTTPLVSLTFLAGTQATGTLTSNNTAPTDGDTVTIDGKVYTAKTTLTPLEGEVLINNTADGFLLNLSRAINHLGTPNTDYKCALPHPTVTAATSLTGHTFAITARVPGTAGNAIATTEEAATLSWGATTLTSGTDATDTIASDVPVYITRTLTAGDVTRGFVEVDTGLTNLTTKFAVRITRSGTAVIHDGTVNVKASSVVLVQNDGNTNFQAGDILQLFAAGTD